MTRSAKQAVFGVFIVLSVMVHCGMGLMPNAEELKTLKEQGDEEAAKERLVAEQDKNFEAVKAAVAARTTRKGDRAKDISKKFGKPVAVDRRDGSERWLYKARSRNQWLKVPRVWLMFDEKDRLSGWECAHTDCN